MSLGADRERGSAGSGDAAAAHLALAIPGVTVSWSQTPYLFVATAASLAIHEVLIPDSPGLVCDGWLRRPDCCPHATMPVQT